MEATLLINQIKNYTYLNDDQEQFLVSKLVYRNCMKGQYLVQQGEICRYEFFIVQGITRTFYLDANGHEHIIMFAIEEWWTSDMGSFTQQIPADYHIQCLENTQVIQFSRELKEELFAAIPQLERFFRKIIERALAATQKRIVRNFSMNARDRYLFFKSHYPTIEQRAPQYMVASYLGITKEFLSKIKSQLVQD